jgi:hypothetical protein
MRKRILRATSLAAFAGCASLPAAVDPGALAMRELPAGAVVTVSRIPPPWYAARFLIVRGFRRAVPEYQAVPGLERKHFTIAADGRFGGIYRWRDRASAKAWFGPKWHEGVRRRWGADGDLRFIDAVRTLDGPAPPVEEGSMVGAIAPGSLEAYRGASGLRMATEGQGQVVSLWRSRADAEGFFAGQGDVEWFDAPIALTNPP